MKFTSVQIAFFVYLIFFNVTGFADEKWGNMHLSYIREVENHLFLSDFQLGSEETIRDREGHGGSIGWLINNTGVSFFLLNIGTSNTEYVGTIEDGVNVSFVPQPGKGFDTLSTSKNIIYNFDLKFENNFVGISYTNWLITRASMETRFFAPSTYGLGFIFQKTSGTVEILDISGVKIAEAKYEPGIQRYFEMGWAFNFEFLFMSILFRNVTSPELTITECNSAAVGALACDRIRAATGNRNSSTQLFTGGVLTIGTLF